MDKIIQYFEELQFGKVKQRGKFLKDPQDWQSKVERMDEPWSTAMYNGEHVSEPGFTLRNEREPGPDSWKHNIEHLEQRVNGHESLFKDKKFDVSEIPYEAEYRVRDGKGRVELTVKKGQVYDGKESEFTSVLTFSEQDNYSIPILNFLVKYAKKAKKLVSRK